MKTFVILVKAYATLIVEAPDYEDAMQVASDNISYGGFKLDEMTIARELKTEYEINSAIRHSSYHSDDLQKKPYSEH